MLNTVWNDPKFPLHEFQREIFTSFYFEFSWSTISENSFLNFAILLLNVNKSSKMLSQIHIIFLTRSGNYIFDPYLQSWIRNFWLWSVVQHQISGGKFKLIGHLTNRYSAKALTRLVLGKSSTSQVAWGSLCAAGL